MSFKEVLKAPGIKPVLFTLFMAAFGFGIILPLLPFYVISLGAQPYELGMLTATFAVMSLLFSPFFGKLGDRVGRKKVIIGGIALFGLSYLVFAISDSLWMAFVARALEGLGVAAVFPASLSLLSDLTTERQRGPAMGLMGMMFSLGFIVGPAFGGIASGVSVPFAFMAAAALSLLNLLSVLFMLKEPKEHAESKDIPAQEISLLQRLNSPLLFLFLSAFMPAFMFGGLDATLALFLGSTLGFGSTEVGFMFMYVGVLIMIMQFVTGSLMNTYGEVALIRSGLLLSGAGFFLLGLVTDWTGLLLPIAIFVVGNALVFPSVNSLISKKVMGKRGAAMGLVSSFQSLGQIVGPLIGGVLYTINHTWAFIGLAAVVLGYFAVFSIMGMRKLEAHKAA